MPNYTSNSSAILKPEQVHDLVIAPLTAASVAAQVSTVVQTNTHDYRIPVLTADPSGEWTPEGAELPLDDADFADIVVTPQKLGAVSVVSQELAQDSSPEASRLIGQRLVNSLRKKVDGAWLANTTPNAPNGLGSLAVTDIYAGAAGFTNVDPFLEALAAVENQGVNVNTVTWVAHPDVALDLARIKEATGSNRGLLQPDATADGLRRVVAGRPLVTTPDAPLDTVYAVPRDLSLVVVRQDAEVTISDAPFFTSHRVAVKVVLRVGFAYPLEGGIAAVRVADAP